MASPPPLPLPPPDDASLPPDSDPEPDPEPVPTARQPPPAGPVSKSAFSRCREGVVVSARAVKNHFTTHVGAGLVAAVAYFDPGNWSVDLQAGSRYGYRMLFVVFVSGIIAVVLQALGTKLGCVTGKDLATHCRHVLHDHPKHPRLVRWLVLYPLYVMAECAIVATDLSELLGSAIALVLFIPSLPLYAAVLITSLDVFIVLLLMDPTRANGRPAKLFEGFIIALVFSVLVSFVILIAKIKPDWEEVFEGYIPSKTIGATADALYTSIGIVGATVMPHALFLGSSLATQNRAGSKVLAPVPNRTRDDDEETDVPDHRYRKNRMQRWLCAALSVERVRENWEEEPSRQIQRFRFIQAHLKNAIIDIVLSLLGCAGVINSAILITAASVFFWKVAPEERSKNPPASLFDTYDVIRDRVGRPAAVLFAGALLTAGQSAAITATLSGQIVSSGFIAWRLSPFLTRTSTRMIALIPATVVAAVVGKEGINALLVASQFILSLVLPFVVLPLVWLTSNEEIMSVPIPEEDWPEGEEGGIGGGGSSHDDKDSGSQSTEKEHPVDLPPLGANVDLEAVQTPGSRSRSRDSSTKEISSRSGEPRRLNIQGRPMMKSYKNSRPMMIFGYVIFVCILGADTIAIISVGRARGT